jgi:hypothetical protein
MPRYKAISHKKRRPMYHKYVLKNISKYDINLGDLRYRIPAGQARDLLSPTAHLMPEDIVASAATGSISKRLGKTLIVAHNTLITPPPSYEEADPSSVIFPQRIKSSIIIGVDDITDEIQELILSEDEEFLKKLEEDSMYSGEDMAPIVAKSDENKED